MPEQYQNPGKPRRAAYGAAYDALFRLRETLGDEELDRRLRLLRRETEDLARHLDEPLLEGVVRPGLLRRLGRRVLGLRSRGAGRGPARRGLWAGGVCALLAVFLLAAVQQAGTDMAEVDFLVEGYSAAGQTPKILTVGKQATVTYRFEGVNEDGTPCVLTRTLRVNPDGTIAGQMRVPSGGIRRVDVTIRNGYIEMDGRKVNRFVGATSLRAGRNEVTVGTNDSWSARRSALLKDALSGAGGVREVLGEPWKYFDEMVARTDSEAGAENRFKTAAVNFFDDVRVTSGDKVILDESFDTTPLRGIPEALINVWDGKAGFVIPDGSAPSPPNSFLSEAMPNHNRHDGIRLMPSDIPSGRLTIELSCKISDVRKGVSFGLKSIRGDYAGEPAGIYLDEGTVFPSGNPTRLATFEARRWYRMRVEMDLKAHVMDVWMDGNQIGRGIPMARDLTSGYGVTHFTFGGVNFLLKK